MRSDQMLARLRLASSMIWTARSAATNLQALDGPEEDVLDEGVKIVDEVVEGLKKRVGRINDRLRAKTVEKHIEAGLVAAGFTKEERPSGSRLKARRAASK